LLGYNDAYPPSGPGPLNYDMVQEGYWVHLALTWHNGESQAYINGKLVPKPTTPLTFEPVAEGLFTTLFAGADSNSAYGGDPLKSLTFPGKIDEVEVFNRVLSQAEIQAIYNAGHAGKCKPGPIVQILVNLFDANQNKTARITDLSSGDAVISGINSAGQNVLQVSSGTINLLGLNINGGTVSQTALTAGNELATSINNKNGGLVAANLSPISVILNVPGKNNITTVTLASATPGLTPTIGFISPIIGTKLDELVVPLSGQVDVTCTSGPAGTDDKCFAGRKEHIDSTNGAALAPVNMQLISPQNEQTVLGKGQTQTVAFNSAVVDGMTYSEPVNFLALAPAGSKMDGDGTDNITCGAQILQQGVVNVLKRFIVNGTQQCSAVREENVVQLHIIDQAKTGACSGAGSCKNPLPGAQVRVFDRGSTAFQTAYGTKNPSGSIYNQVYENDIGRVSACTTDSTGSCTAYEQTAGDYLAVVKYLDARTGKTVYTGLPKSATDFTDTNADGVKDYAKKEFQIIKTIKKDGTVQWSGGQKVVVTGSRLDVVYPLDAVWDEGATSYIYPYIFTSADNWDVDVCSQVPAGYDIVGVYDENGNLVTNKDCYKTFVAGETKVVAFEVVMTGSPPEWAMNTKLVVKHNGKSKTLNLNVPSHVKKH